MEWVVRVRVVTSYNKYSQITARALRQCLKQEERLASEKRGLTSLRYQKWENGVGGQQARLTLFALAKE